MNWRSEGWGKEAFEFTKGSPEARAYFEAGADAMLREIKKLGNYYNDAQAPCKTIGILKEIKESGWLVFIPDKEGK